MKLCGYKNGEIGNGRKKECQNGTSKLSLDTIASQLGTSNCQNGALKLSEIASQLGVLGT